MKTNDSEKLKVTSQESKSMKEENRFQQCKMDKHQAKDSIE